MDRDTGVNRYGTEHGKVFPFAPFRASAFVSWFGCLSKGLDRIAFILACDLKLLYVSYALGPKT